MGGGDAVSSALEQGFHQAGIETPPFRPIEIDHARNARNDLVISSDLARTTVMVIPTVEALVIVRAALALLEVRSGQARSTRH